ncbi:MAG: hypothetical protein IT357_18290 [Gemmatimonadaceae bacterium]|nr:hypothetical protein [Gemmatimonadaceae bacterium]
MISPTLRALRHGLTAVLALTLASACADDTIVTPTFGAGCSAGTLRPGQPRRSALNEDSCIEQYNLWSNNDVAYESHTLQTDEGQAYMVSVAKRPDLTRNGRNGLYPVLTAWGRGTGGVAAPLALSEGDAANAGAELFFVAPRRSALQLVVSSYDDAAEYEYLGGYEIAAQRCPVLRLNADTGSTALTLKDSPCVRSTEHRMEYGGDTLAYNFITIAVKAGERLSFRATAADFTPAWEAFGPSTDTYGYLGYPGARSRYLGEESRSLDFLQDGTMTLAIGAINVTGPSKQFTLHVTRSLSPALR